MAAAMPVRVSFRSRDSSASFPVWQPAQPFDWKSCAPESDGGNEKMPA